MLEIGWVNFMGMVGDTISLVPGSEYVGEGVTYVKERIGEEADSWADSMELDAIEREGLGLVGDIAEYGTEAAIAGKVVKLTGKIKHADTPDLKHGKGDVKSQTDVSFANKVDSYEEAIINGGKHSGWAKQYLDKPLEEIQKGIKSLEKQIELHQDKIRNPEKYYPDFKKLDVRRQEANINKIWPAEILRFNEQKEILSKILQKRSD